MRDDAISALARILSRENAALAEMDLSAAVALLPEKVTAMARLPAAGPTQSTPVPSEDLRRLSDLALENRRLLERAMAAQERVIGIVADAIASAMAQPCYGARGQVSPAPGPLAISTRA